MCTRLVVAPPISSGSSKPCRSISAATWHISSSDGRDQAGEPDDVRVLLLRRLQDFRRRHHHAEIDHLVIVALEHDADDVLADVVHVALDRGHDDLAVGALLLDALLLLLLLHERHQIGDRLLHHARGFHHLRQEHLAGAEQIADHVHAVHQRAFDHVQRALGLAPRLLDVAFDEIGDAVHQRVREPLLDRPLAPGEIGLLLLLAVAAIALGEREQPLGGVRRAG